MNASKPNAEPKSTRREASAPKVRSAVKAGPNSRKHDHLTDHNWMLEIEGVTQGA